ncbi:hypothetical protein Plhal304r1_c044g0124641 [Plasmopara halstedii]
MIYTLEWRSTAFVLIYGILVEHRSALIDDGSGMIAQLVLHFMNRSSMSFRYRAPAVQGVELNGVSPTRVGHSTAYATIESLRV